MKTNNKKIGAGSSSLPFAVTIPLHAVFPAASPGNSCRFPVPIGAAAVA